MSKVNKLLEALYGRQWEAHRWKGTAQRSSIGTRRTFFFNWLEQNGAVSTLQFDKSNHRDSQRGMRTTTRVPRDGTYIKVPAKVHLTLKSARASSVGGLLHREGWWREKPRYALAVFLAYERVNTSSFFQPFLDTVTTPDVPVWWPYTEVTGNLIISAQNLVLEAKLEAIIGYCTAYEDLYRNQKRGKGGFSLSPLPFQDWVWGLGAVDFLAERLDSTRAESLTLIPGHHFLDHSNKNNAGQVAKVVVDPGGRWSSPGVSLVAPKLTGPGEEVFNFDFKAASPLTVEEYFIKFAMVPPQALATTIYRVQQQDSLLLHLADENDDLRRDRAEALSLLGSGDFTLGMSPALHPGLIRYMAVLSAAHAVELRAAQDEAWGTKGYEDIVAVALGKLRTALLNSLLQCTAQRNQGVSMGSRVDIRRFFLGQDACIARKRVLQHQLMLINDTLTGLEPLVSAAKFPGVARRQP